MISFSYSQMQKLKTLTLASIDKWGYTSEQFRREAMKRGISREDAVFFYEDIMEELHTSSRPRHVVEAFLPLWFKVRYWNPLDLDASTYTSVEELVRDLEELNNSSINSSVKRHR